MTLCRFAVVQEIYYFVKMPLMFIMLIQLMYRVAHGRDNALTIGAESELRVHLTQDIMITELEKLVLKKTPLPGPFAVIFLTNVSPSTYLICWDCLVLLIHAKICTN